MTDTTFVYNGIEVKMTGRYADKHVEQRTSTRRGINAKRVDTVYEIIPVNPEEGSWAKWVPKKDLYEIRGPESSSETD